MRPVVVRPPEKLRPATGGPSAPEPEPREGGRRRKRLIRIAGAANDNVPGWAMRLGRLIVVGIVVALVVAAAILALV